MEFKKAWLSTLQSLINHIIQKSTQKEVYSFKNKTHILSKIAKPIHIQSNQAPKSANALSNKYISLANYWWRMSENYSRQKLPI